MKKVSVLLFPFFCFSLFSASALEPQLEVSAGYRVDRGQWTIAGPDDDPNIISDLEWEDLNVFELRVGGELHVGPLVVSPRLAFGFVSDGENRDSDYVFDNREGEFSRSTAESEGDTLDLELAIGYPIQRGEGVTWVPHVGFAMNQQNLNDTDGFQVVDRPDLEAILDGDATGLGPDDGFLGPFDDLDSEYESEWTSFFFGLELVAQLSEKTSVSARYRFHFVDYEADLYWNLRDLSFTNEADGDGHSLQAVVNHQMSESLSFHAGIHYTMFETDAGVQSDPFGPIKLNGAEWESLGFFLGLGLAL